MFDVASDVPIGAVRTSKRIGDSSLKPRSAEVEIPEGEKDKFDVWLRDLWREKDESITTFLETGTFSGGRQRAGVEIPLKLRRKREILDAFCFFLPVCACYLWGKLQ